MNPPAWHTRQDVAPVSAYSPARHGRHWLAPSPGETVSGGQAVQAVELGPAEYAPARHVWHPPAYSSPENCPGWHTRHSRAPPAAVYNPAPHAVHAVASKSGE